MLAAACPRPLAGEPPAEPPPAPARSVAEEPPALDLACPNGTTRSDSVVARGQRQVSCLDAAGKRQGAGLLLRSDGSRVALTGYRDDFEDGALTLFDEAGALVARGQMAGGRLLSFEVDPKQDRAAGALKPLEDRLRDEIGRAQRCDQDADCVVAEPGKCPFGCGIVTHKDEAQRIAELLRAFPSRCTYRCQAGGAPRCVAQRCELAFH